MLAAVLILFFILLVIYSIIILRFAFFLSDIKANGVEAEPHHLFVTLVVPVRNEESNLPGLFRSLADQDMDTSCYEVVFVNDHSADHTLDLLEEVCRGKQNFSVLNLDENSSGKKAAIDLAISISRGTWILQTDADCTFSPGFIRSHWEKAAIDKASLITGLVVIEKSNRYWNKIEGLEFLSLSATGLASVLSGNPLMCNGANMSYAKSFYLECREELLNIDSPSGDDMFLLLEARKRRKVVAALTNSDSVVSTIATGSLRAFISQRVRWGSKTGNYSDAAVTLLAALVWLVNLGLSVALITGFFLRESFAVFSLALLLKSIADYVLLSRASRLVSRKDLLYVFPLTALFYYFYISLSGMLSMIGSFSWKGRKYR